MKELIKDTEPNKIITVGDTVSANLTKKGIHPHVFIIDNKIMRKPITPIKVDADQTFHIKNPPGTITDEAWQAMKEALKHKGRVKIVVEGEDDLLTLVAVACAPENSIVVYGQPDEGIVVIKVTEEMKELVSKLIDEMEYQDSKKLI